MWIHQQYNNRMYWSMLSVIHITPCSGAYYAWPFDLINLFFVCVSKKYANVMRRYGLPIEQTYKLGALFRIFYQMVKSSSKMMVQSNNSHPIGPKASITPQQNYITWVQTSISLSITTSWEINMYEMRIKDAQTSRYYYENRMYTL